MRAVKFYAVGGIGIGVQAATLGLLVHVFGVHYLWATALAVTDSTRASRAEAVFMSAVTAAIPGS